MDLKKLKKSSSKKLIKGGLGFFLSPRDDSKDLNQGTSFAFKGANATTSEFTKTNDWGSNHFKVDKCDDNKENDKNPIEDIPMIPSIDDLADDITNEIAKAPLVSSKQVVPYKELENDILRHSAFTSLEEINVRVLIKGLHHDSSINEPDVPWTREGLFQELVSKSNEGIFRLSSSKENQENAHYSR